ncbi:hypothetical protein FRC06_011263 [Ceratobasidium sp. 370]|nr:hypothetical protein FRC06_011263 [Ceratobasidium sp. 370]
MSVWNISAVFTNVTTAWERGFSSSRTIRRKDTVVLLKEIDELLRDSSDLLENHRRLFPPGEYESFKAQHRTYHWKLSDEKKRSEDINETPLLDPSKLQADKEANRTRAAQLLETVKTYRTNLLGASRNVAAGPRIAFPDEEPLPTDQAPIARTQTIPPIPTEKAPPQPAMIPTPRPSTPVRVSTITVLPTTGLPPDVGLMGMLRTRSPIQSQTAVGTTGQTLIEGQGFAIAIAHIAVEPDKNLYKRLISVKIGDRQMQIPDTELHVLESHELDVDEKKLAGVFMLVGRSLLELDDFQKTVEELQREID